jgi:hypothetical protein
MLSKNKEQLQRQEEVPKEIQSKDVITKILHLEYRITDLASSLLNM